MAWIGAFALVACTADAPGGSADPGASAAADGGALLGEVEDTAAPPECTTDEECRPILRDQGECRRPTCDEGRCVSAELPAGSECDDGDACTTNDACAGRTCRGEPLRCDDGEPCTVDRCDAEQGCLSDGAPMDGEGCDDGDACVTGERCDGGVCGGGEAVSCDDGEACTVDGCDPASGCTVDRVTLAGEDCDDGDACTLLDACDNGVCKGQRKDCNDGNQCTVDSCDARTGECDRSAEAADGGECSDGDRCTADDRCARGACLGTAKACDDEGECSLGSCDAAIGECVYDREARRGEACDDGDACTTGDACSGGEAGCVGAPVPCDDGLDCTVDACDPADGSCRHDGVVTEGMGCDDGAACTVDDTCVGGRCEGTAVVCDDVEPCTTDSCDEATGACRHDAAPRHGADCDDGDACTAADRCAGGVCVGRAAACDDDNLCTLDACDPVSGACTHDPAPLDGERCDDGARCTGDDRCDGGACAGTPLVCPDTEACLEFACDPASGLCVPDAAPREDEPCDDATRCTVDDRCVAGSCEGQDKDCDDDEPCTVDRCVERTGGCVNDADTAFGTECDDGDECTDADLCLGNGCEGTPRLCNDEEDCTDDRCDSATGDCVFDGARLEGSGCDDGDPCFAEEVCTGGACVGEAVDCNDGNSCTVDDCVASEGGCVHDGAPQQGSVCAPTSFCVVSARCDDGACAVAERDCGDAVPCTVDSCDDDARRCVHDAAAAEGLPCDDGDHCRIDDACAGGSCVGVPTDCDDLDPCTADSCDEQTGDCVHDAAGADGSTCSDGDFCTVDDTCRSGSCRGVPNLCSDGETCTADSCDEAADRCVHDDAAREGADCNDDNPCTLADGCRAGTCLGTARDCTDDNPCTADGCNEADGECVHDTAPRDGASCNDGVACTFDDRCGNGRCSGTAPECSDDNECTTDACDPDTGGCLFVRSTRDGMTCTDDDPCTVDERCADGACLGSQKGCDDGNDCTVDACEAATGDCLHDGGPREGAACDDGLACRVDELCVGGVCAGAPKNCSDASDCTDDACNAETGECEHDATVLQGAGCDDDDDCTTGDTCSAGACEGEPLPCVDGQPCTEDRCEAGECQHPLVDCDDQNPCTRDTCNPATGACEHAGESLDGVPCDDGVPCTRPDVCDGGTCAGPLDSCDDGEVCTVDRCDAVSGDCSNDAGPLDGQPCNDGDPCTIDGDCTAGTCPGTDRDCDDGEACTVDSCSAAAGGCVHDGAPKEDDACDPGDACVLNAACGAGACVGERRVCDDEKVCTADRCDASSGECVFAPIAGCGENHPCVASTHPTSSDVAITDCVCGQPAFAYCCTSRWDDFCVGRAELTCGLECDCANRAPEERRCGADADCAFCRDDDLCDGRWQCSAGTCVESGPVTCDATDDTECVFNTCAPATGQCSPTPDHGSCDDGDICTTDQCDASGGACQRDPIDGCGDNHPCEPSSFPTTRDEAVTACVCALDDFCCNNRWDDSCITKAAQSCGAECDCPSADPADLPCTADRDCSWCGLHNRCFGRWACVDGACAGAAPVDCDDEDPCTADACAPETGACSHDPIAGCGDNDPCVAAHTPTSNDAAANDCVCALDASCCSDAWSTECVAIAADRCAVDCSCSGGDMVTAGCVDASCPRCDPLVGEQWHLDNTGQSGGAAGEDAGVQAAWEQGVTGDGAVVAIVDDGLEIDHEDLSANVVAGASHDYVSGGTDPTGGGAGYDGPSVRGTQLAGIVAARDMNAFGGRGVAPRAGLVAFNLTQDLTDANLADAVNRARDHADVALNTWAAEGAGQLIAAPATWRDALRGSLASGRSGRGVNHVWPSGDGAPAANANQDAHKVERGSLVVGAVDHRGERVATSAPGANLWVAAPGAAHLITTDRAGAEGVNAGVAPDLADPDYTNTAGGTRAAAAIVAGVVALCLDANPLLTWRDVRLILARTARRNDPGDVGWVVNGAGRAVHHDYGFGVVDAGEAVRTAAAWINLPPEVVHHTGTITANDTIPANDAGGARDAVTISGSAVGAVEYVEVTVTLTHEDHGRLAISLTHEDTSTTSVLAEARSCGDRCASFSGWTFGSARHLDEAADGTWSLRVVDTGAGASGTLESWSLSVYGR